MEIRFSIPGDSQALMRYVDKAAAHAHCAACLSKAKENHIRFVLRESWDHSSPMASDKAHDRVIRALLTLDPEATVRTARATYNGKDDFERQCKARTGV